MKQIFTNLELAHVWMSQKQSYGQNASRSMFFIDDTIYSYSVSFPLAKIFKKEKIILVNNGNTTKNTTTKHYPAVRRALDENNYRVYYAAFAEGRTTKIMDMTLEATAEYLYQNIYEVMGEILAGNATYDEMQGNILRYQNFCKLAQLKIKKVQLPKHFETLLKELSKLNWDKMLAKQERKKELAATKEARAIAKAEKNIEAWKRGEMIDISRLPRIYLRAFVDSLNKYQAAIQTSKGAIVPYQDAIDLWNDMQCYPEANFIGREIGHYTISAVNKDKIIIGCHVLEKAVLEEFLTMN